MKINLSQIALSQGWSVPYLGELLYPTNAYPAAAVRRVLDGISELNESQITLLAQTLGVTYEELFNNKNRWTANHSDGLHVFDFGEFRAVLNPLNWITKIYKGGILQQEGVISNKETLLSEYLEILEKAIIKLN